MKLRWFNLLLLYLLIPAVIIWLTLSSGDWWSLFAIAFYFLGIVLSQFRQWVFLPVPLFFCMWYWYTYGLSIHDYVTIFFGCLVLGILLSEVSKEYYKFINKVLPEQINNLDYNEKVDELNRRLDRYRQDHPNEKLTPEIVEKIRTEVFF